MKNKITWILPAEESESENMSAAVDETVQKVEESAEMEQGILWRFIGIPAEAEWQWENKYIY